MTQPTVSRHWRRVVSHPDRPQSNHAHLTVLQYYNMHAEYGKNQWHTKLPLLGLKGSCQNSNKQCPKNHLENLEKRTQIGRCKIIFGIWFNQICFHLHTTCSQTSVTDIQYNTQQTKPNENTLSLDRIWRDSNSLSAEAGEATELCESCSLYSHIIQTPKHNHN